MPHCYEINELIAELMIATDEAHEEACVTRSVLDGRLEGFPTDVVPETDTARLSLERRSKLEMCVHVDGPLLLEDLPCAGRLVVEHDVCTERFYVFDFIV